MSLARLSLDAARVAVFLGLALAAMPLLRRAPSSARRLVLALALSGALVLPAVTALAPALRIDAPSAIATLGGNPELEPLEEAAAPAPRGPAPAVRVSRPAASAVRVDWRDLVLALWAAGALVVLSRLALGLVRTRAMVRRSRAAPAWAPAVARAERSTGRRAEVRITDELDAPAVTGVLAPVVLVPRASEAWSDERRHAVLLHELAHVRQADCLVYLVAQLACAASWFDPLAWLALRRLRVERELAADDAVIAWGARASSYAEHLLAIAGVHAIEAPAGALGMADPSELAARVTAIVSAERARSPLGRARSAALVAGALTALVAVACATPSVRAPEPAKAPSSSAALAPPASGKTIDPALQAFAEQELERAVTEWQAAAGAVLVLEPSTGEIRANAGRERGAPADVALRNAYITGSTLKAVTLAAALEEGVVAPTDRIDCENGRWLYDGQTMRDAAAHGSLSLPEVLATSSNIGFTKLFDRLGATRLDHWLRAFHFGAAPAIEGAVAGELPPPVGEKSFQGAVVAIGEWMTATPLQLAAAYATFANDGAYVAPTLTPRTAAAPREQLIKPETARQVVAMLDEAVNGERATGKKARIAEARVAGKTGTGSNEARGGPDQTYASFVGLVPVEHPRFVIVVGLEGARGGESGGKVAAPVFARVASRALAR